MRRTILVVALGFVLVACSTATDEATTTATVAAEEPSATTTTTVVEATAMTEAVATTTATEVVVFGYSNDLTTLHMRVDRIYLHDLNEVPLAFEFAEPGWTLFFVGDDLMGMFHSTEPMVAFHVSFFPGASATDVAADISQRIETEIQMVDTEEIGGVEALVFEVGPGFGRELHDPDRPCLSDTLIEERVLDDRVNTFLAPCSVNRVWLVEFDDATVALHVSDLGGTVEQPGDLVRVEPLIDEFLAAITFEP